VKHHITRELPVLVLNERPHRAVSALRREADRRPSVTAAEDDEHLLLIVQAWERRSRRDTVSLAAQHSTGVKACLSSTSKASGQRRLATASWSPGKSPGEASSAESGLTIAGAETPDVTARVCAGGVTREAIGGDSESALSRPDVAIIWLLGPRSVPADITTEGRHRIN